MKFTKIDEKTVRCVVSREEMEAYDVELEDFIKKNKKVRDFVELLIDKAEDEVGYEHMHGMVQLQLQPLPKRGLAITFSNRELNPGELSQEIASKMGEEMADAFLNAIENLTDEEKREKIRETMESLEEANEKVQEKWREEIPSGKADLKKSSKPKKKKEKPAGQVPSCCICRFESLRNLGAFCIRLGGRTYVNSSVYKDEGKQEYYLVLEKGRCKMEKYLNTCRLAMEFSTIESCQTSRKIHLEEQCSLLVKDRAVSVFRNIYKG